jgi:hypothetical protein
MALFLAWTDFFQRLGPSVLFRRQLSQIEPVTIAVLNWFGLDRRVSYRENGAAREIHTSFR